MVNTNKKAVTIAKDVISLLNMHLIKAKTGDYVSLVASEEEWDIKSLQKILKKRSKTKNPKPCFTCGIGACLVARIWKKNNFNIDSDNFYTDRGAVEDGLKDTFSERELDLIESAFEMIVGSMDGNIEYEQWDAVRFGKQYKSDRNRLIAIMNNIIENKGRFIPKVYATKD